MENDEIQRYLCLDFLPTHFQHVKIPKGQRLFVGKVGKQPKLLDKDLEPIRYNGGLQFQIKARPGEMIDNFEGWFTNKWLSLEEL